MKTKHLLLFDIDGTLLIMGGAGRIAFERAFQECHGVADSWGQTKPDGKTDPVIFQEIALRYLGRALTPVEMQKLSELYLKYFEEEAFETKRFRLMPGTHALLKDLHERDDVILGLATGNFEESARIKLKCADMDHYFVFGGFASDSMDRQEIVRIAAQRRMDLAKNDANVNLLVIGDTPKDIRAAKANGLKSLGVATGKYETHALKEHGPEYVLEDLTDVKKFYACLSAS